MGYNIGKNHPKFIDLTGRKFGKLTVLEYTEIQEKHSKVWKWKCQCECGKITFTRTKEFLKLKPVQSCASCGRKRMGIKRTLPDNLSLKNRVFRVYKKGARNRGYDFSLTFEQVMNIINQKCHYCNKSPENIEGEFTRNGIDRKDNKLGYSIENTVPCCKTCNKMKMDMDYNEFIKHISEIYKQIKFNDYLEREYTIS